MREGLIELGKHKLQVRCWGEGVEAAAAPTVFGAAVCCCCCILAGGVVLWWIVDKGC